MKLYASMTDDLEQSLMSLAESLEERVPRPAAHAGVLVFYNRARELAPVYKGAARYGTTPGQLRDAIYRVFSKGSSSDEVKVYQVSWNHYKAPHGWWMEYGNSQHGPKPYIRPAFDFYEDALEAARKRARELTTEIIAEHSHG